MLACSSFVDSNIEHQCKSVGFDEIFEAPLSANVIKNQIIPMIEKRKVE